MSLPVAAIAACLTQGPTRSWVMCMGDALGRADIRRHLAFRDAPRGNGPLRAAYSAVKGACAARHPEGGVAYGTCKSAWIDNTKARALEKQR